MPFVEDIDAFFDVDEFASAATWGGSAVPVPVIFDRDYAEPFAGLAEDAQPSALAPAARMPGVKHGDTLVVDGITYRVRGVEPDGTGVVRLRLEKQ